MMRTLLSLSMILLCFFGNTQRSVDLELVITSHADGDFMVTETPIDFTAEVINLGTGTLEVTDSVYYYIIIYSDSFTLSLEYGNHEVYTGMSYSPSQSFETIQTIGFSSGFNGITTDLCVYAKPMNSTSPISDPVLTNNKNCVSITFIDEADLSVGANGSDAIKLSPNPANTSFSITKPKQDEQLTIIDMNGQEVPFDQSFEGLVDCSHWKNGVYFVRWANSTENFVQRMVVSH